MPPKKAAAQGPSKKELEKKKAKAIEDRTFGLKNKKGAKMQKYIQQVENNIRNSGPQKGKAGEKKKDKDDLLDLNNLFKPVQSMPKVAGDVDPKSVLCVFFKQGLCQKGNKCKFSHDLAVEQKTAKRNLYVDSRDLKKEEGETNENWDEDQLKDVAEKKHGDMDRKRPNQTDIVCKYFLDAVEDNKYGWFWECPNGAKCIYRHALPSGYVLKKDRKKLEDLKKLETISLEELIEKERASLNTAVMTKVTLESFIAWKKRKIVEKRKKVAEAEKQKKANLKQGKQGGMSGRDLFTYNPDMVGEDDDEAQADAIEREVEEGDGEEEVKAFEIDERTFYNIGEGGKFLDEDLDDAEATTAEETPAAPTGADAEKQPTVFNEDLFDDGDIPDDLDDESDEDEPGPSGSAGAAAAADSLSRLKV
uniref:Zinc finger CCCH domain-containing protein 15 homolog n=1 Tax=Panagrellus redivivus TaxID=6233 RepID=A0A7E4V2T0_PANRE